MYSWTLTGWKVWLNGSAFPSLFSQGMGPKCQKLVISPAAESIGVFINLFIFQNCDIWLHSSLISKWDVGLDVSGNQKSQNGRSNHAIKDAYKKGFQLHSYGCHLDFLTWVKRGGALITELWPSTWFFFTLFPLKTFLKKWLLTPNIYFSSIRNLQKKIK